jgi:hypothetical protein
MFFLKEIWPGFKKHTALNQNVMDELNLMGACLENGKYWGHKAAQNEWRIAVNSNLEKIGFLINLFGSIE